MDYKIKIAISGAAETGLCGPDVENKAIAIGRAIAEQGAVILTGATTGFPELAARGAKEAGGFSIGFSPAANEEDHVLRWKMPTEYMDLIVYTDIGFEMRDIILMRSADASIFGCGRVGTIHEFTVAFEGHKPIGVLKGPWIQDEIIKEIIDGSGREKENPYIYFEEDPKILVEKLVKAVKDTKIARQAILSKNKMDA